jgi:hypothetical protein
MKLHQGNKMLALPTSLLMLVATIFPLASSQFIYPPPLPRDKTLADYTSGRAEPIRDYVIHDAIIGSIKTPKPTFPITRCAKEGRTEPILPSKESFTSSEGRLVDDGTWQMMDSWIDWAGANKYSKGKNLWIIPDFEYYVGNDTTGRICWWELYSVSEVQFQTPFDLNGVSKVVPKVTLLGEDTENYFASMPFIVNTQMRPGNRNYTWSSSGGKDNRASSTTISISNRPTDNAAPQTLNSGLERHGGQVAILSLLGVFFGLGA